MESSTNNKNSSSSEAQPLQQFRNHGRNSSRVSSIDPVVAVFVYDFLQYKLAGYQLRVPANVREAGRRTSTNVNRVGNALRSLADEFSSQFKDQFTEMCDQLEVNEETMRPTIEGVANELFSDGIKWARIVAFFVFGSELAVHCKKRNWNELIELIAQSVSSYITEKLLPWINDHGGWEGLVIFQEGAAGDMANGRDNRWPSVRNLLCVGLSAIGALTIGAVLTKS